MNSIEINYEEIVVCPFCQHVIVDLKSDEFMITPCAHLVYAATDVCLEFRSELINQLFEIDPKEENFELGLEDIIDHPDFENILENGQLKGLIHYESYEPSPSFFGAYYGYIQNL
jgi:hypothetical protein